MSTAEPACERGHRARGFTIFELMVGLSILGVMMTIVEHTLSSAHRAEQRLHAIRHVTERGERLAYEILAEVDRSRKLFQNDAAGEAYLDALNRDRDPPLAGARLPLFDELNPLAPDLMGDPRTGNVLLFVTEAEATQFVADPSVGKTRSIDLYRFICIYPAQTDRLLLVNEARLLARDLVIWRSVVFPSHAQIMAIEDEAERLAVVADVVEQYGSEHAWNTDADVETAFFALSAGGEVSLSATPDPTIEEDLEESERGRLVYADVQLARTEAFDYYRRSELTRDDPDQWTPDGFELKIVGVSGARKLWYRLCMESPAGNKVVGVQACTMTANPRDM